MLSWKEKDEMELREKSRIEGLGLEHVMRELGENLANINKLYDEREILELMKRVLEDELASRYK